MIFKHSNIALSIIFASLLFASFGCGSGNGATAGGFAASAGGQCPACNMTTTPVQQPVNGCTCTTASCEQQGSGYVNQINSSPGYTILNCQCNNAGSQYTILIPSLNEAHWQFYLTQAQKSPQSVCRGGCNGYCADPAKPENCTWDVSMYPPVVALQSTCS